jgi:hypothetical protein
VNVFLAMGFSGAACKTHDEFESEFIVAARAKLPPETDVPLFLPYFS